MCRGVVRGRGTECAVSPRMKTEAVPCELCGSRAKVYCQADGAYLCRECDGRVHGANFLAGRHVRCLLCNHCQKLTRRYVVTSSPEGAAVDPARLVRLGDSSKAKATAFGTPFLFI
ncbi:hypothetical protein MLD38_033392 [Melastoma candidum]|uniref:Uncharacterized protein n=1 Tax=Melastoma candidum TaxID=119954 RepID=A0ACB9M989_9MYRT|nr:hypothetical protein MLD38_033392 [Melastoma candidum]